MLIADLCSAANCALFDYLVGAGEHRRRHVAAERLGGLEVDDELELGRLSMMVFAYLPFRQQ
jgi:hypothetical protein